MGKVTFIAVSLTTPQNDITPVAKISPINFKLCFDIFFLFPPGIAKSRPNTILNIKSFSFVEAVSDYGKRLLENLSIAGAGADVAAHIDDEDLIGHIDLALVHVVQHLLRALGPHLVVARMPEQPDRNDNVSLERQPLLRLHELILEARASAQCYYFVVALHSHKDLRS